MFQQTDAVEQYTLNLSNIRSPGNQILMVLVSGRGTRRIEGRRDGTRAVEGTTSHQVGRTPRQRMGGEDLSITGLYLIFFSDAEKLDSSKISHILKSKKLFFLMEFEELKQYYRS